MWPTNKDSLGELGILVENEDGVQKFMPIDKCIATVGSERQKDKKKLLVIELDDIDSVPTVYYKGEKVDPKDRVEFDWKEADGFYHSNVFYQFWQSTQANELERIYKQKTFNDELSSDS